jgi:hypothetical protein
MPKVSLDKGNFYDGLSVDDALIQLHQAFKFIGMTKLPSFTFHDVFTSKVDDQLTAYETFIKSNI